MPSDHDFRTSHRCGARTSVSERQYRAVHLRKEPRRGELVGTGQPANRCRAVVRVPASRRTAQRGPRATEGTSANHPLAVTRHTRLLDALNTAVQRAGNAVGVYGGSSRSLNLAGVDCLEIVYRCPLRLCTAPAPSRGFWRPTPLPLRPQRHEPAARAASVIGGLLSELGKKLAERWLTLLVLPGALYDVGMR